MSETKNNCSIDREQIISELMTDDKNRNKAWFKLLYYDWIVEEKIKARSSMKYICFKGLCRPCA